jgi:DNA repair protein RadC
MKIKVMPWLDRPETWLKRCGPDSLSDAELLAMVLKQRITTENIINFSNYIMNKTDLQTLVDMSLSELTKTLDNDEINALKIFAMFSLFRRTNRF